MNSLEAISVRKCEPPFLTQVSVSFSVDSWMLGFLFPIRFFNDRIASLGCTVFDRIRSEISRLKAMSSRELAVARSICSSRAVVPEENQPAISETENTARYVEVVMSSQNEISIRSTRNFTQAVRDSKVFKWLLASVIRVVVLVACAHFPRSLLRRIRESYVVTPQPHVAYLMS